MKKSILMLALMLPLSLFSQDFRNCKWGESKREVKSKEAGSNFSDVPGNINYLILEDGKVGNFSASITYGFVNDKLVMGGYIISESHSNNNTYLNDFLEIREILEIKYGKGDNKTIWNDDLYKDDANDYGMAVAAGHLELVTKYSTPETDIIHHLSGDNFEISHGIVYSSVLYNYLIIQAKQKDKTTGF